MTTREQRLREFLGKLRGPHKKHDSNYMRGYFKSCTDTADELAAILAEPVEVSEEMVERFIWGWRSAKPLLVLRPGMDDYAIRTALMYALKESAQ